MVGGCYVYDISTAYVAIGDKIYCKYASEISAGDILTFGKIPSSDATYGGQDINWKVLEVKEDKILVISEKVLMKMKQATTECVNDWNDSLVKAYLNNTSSDGFVSQYGIAVPIIAAEEGEAGYNAGELFLLANDSNELNKYFATKTERVANNLAGESQGWWLRSAYTKSQDGLVEYTYIFYTGSISGLGADVEAGVRPAFWISLE